MNIFILSGHLAPEHHSYVWGIYHLLMQTTTLTPKVRSPRYLLPNSLCSIGHLHVLVKCIGFPQSHPTLISWFSSVQSLSRVQLFVTP